VVLVYTTLFGIGKLVFGETGAGLALLAAGAAAFVTIIRKIGRE
jgi:hypothetical protein